MVILKLLFSRHVKPEADFHNEADSFFIETTAEINAVTILFDSTDYIKLALNCNLQDSDKRLSDISKSVRPLSDITKDKEISRTKKTTCH